MKVGLSLSLVISVLVTHSRAILVDPSIENIRELIQSELNKPQDNSRSQYFPGGIQISQGFTGNNGGVSNLSGKPEKISVTIFKEYKVQKPDGETGYVSIQEQGGDFKGSLNPPQINAFIQQHTQNYDSQKESLVMTKAEPMYEDPYQFQEVPSQDQQSQIRIQPSQPLSSESSSIRFPTSPYKRKTMDGWIPLYGKSLQSGHLSRGAVTSLYKNYAGISKSHYVKGMYVPGKDIQSTNSIEGAASAVQPQVVPFVSQGIQQQGQSQQIVQAQLVHQQFQQPQQIVQAQLVHQQVQPQQIVQDQLVHQQVQPQQTVQPQLVQNQPHTFVPQATIPIIQPHLQYFTQNEVISGINQGQVLTNGEASEQVVQTHVKNLVIDKPSEVQSQRAPVYPGVSMVPPKVVIHAQNVIIHSDTSKNQTQASQQQQQRSPNVSQIKAYGAAPQITALLREQFRLSNNKPFGHPLNGHAFPKGGLSLSSLAQAIRNGAFSLENDVIPSQSMQEKLQQNMEITIPHSFKIRNPRGGYSTVNTQGLAAPIGDSVSDPSVNTPTRLQAPGRLFRHQQQHFGSYAAPGQANQAEGYDSYAQGSQGGGYGAPQGNFGGGYGSQLQSGSYGAPHRSPPKLNTNLRGGSDYGDSVKYLDKSPSIDIVDTQPAGEGYGSGGSGGGWSNQNAEELKQKLKQMVLQELAAQLAKGQVGLKSQQYGPPPSVSISDDYDQSKYISPPSDGHQKPLVEFDFDLGHTKDAHHDDGHGQVSLLEASPVEEDHGHGHGSSAKESLVKFGKNLFWGALDFSRKYNPITFVQKVKEFPPIRFEVYDDHKGHDDNHDHGHHERKGKKKRRAQNRILQ